jgi:hypothetical protein
MHSLKKINVFVDPVSISMHCLMMATDAATAAATEATSRLPCAPAPRPFTALRPEARPVF